MIANLNTRDIKFPVANTYRLLTAGIVGKSDVATLTDFVEMKAVSLANAKRIGQLTDLDINVNSNWIHCMNCDNEAIEKCYADDVKIPESVTVATPAPEEPVVVEAVKPEEFAEEPEVETVSNDAEPIEIEAPQVDLSEPVTINEAEEQPVAEEVKLSDMGTNQPIKLNKKHRH